MVPCTLSWFHFWASQIFKHCIRWHVINENKSTRTTLIFSNLFITGRSVAQNSQTIPFCILSIFFIVHNSWSLHETQACAHDSYLNCLALNMWAKATASLPPILYMYTNIYMKGTNLCRATLALTGSSFRSVFNNITPWICLQPTAARSIQLKGNLPAVSVISLFSKNTIAQQAVFFSRDAQETFWSDTCALLLSKMCPHE